MPIWVSRLADSCGWTSAFKTPPRVRRSPVSLQTGTESNLFQLVASAGAQIRAKVGVAPVSEVEGGRVRESIPSSPPVARLYAEGLSKLGVFDNLEARDLLEQVVKADPGYAPGHSALSSAYASLGYDGAQSN